MCACVWKLMWKSTDVFFLLKAAVSRQNGKDEHRTLPGGGVSPPSLFSIGCVGLNPQHDCCRPTFWHSSFLFNVSVTDLLTYNHVKKPTEKEQEVEEQSEREGKLCLSSFVGHYSCKTNQWQPDIIKSTE